MAFKERSILPGFGLTMGFTVFYLCLLVLIPLSTLFIKSAAVGWDKYLAIISHPRALASYRLSFGASLIASVLNICFGFVVAWVLVRYRFPAKKFMDALVDVPFALPTAVAGISLTMIYAPTGWIGKWLLPAGIKTAYSPLGVVIALIFISLPFAVRTIEPVLQEIEKESEEAAASLGANRWQIFSRVIFPAVLPAVLTGFALCFARALGEYGSIVFISGNMPFKTEIAPFLIVTKLEQYDYSGATAIGSVMLVASFLLLFTINGLQWWSRKVRGMK